MEPEPTIRVLMDAIQILTSQVGALQDVVKAQGKLITQILALSKETNSLVSNKDQAKPGPATGPTTPPSQQGGQANTSRIARPVLLAPFQPSRTRGYDSEEE
ncbi:hypothetical protein RhiTH_001527 [Rhizoctonia solani]|uniref:Uncharacterized protein n=1 Tax=Rhizoctonia solani TaxID=456999 RepID=A0A8H7LZV9_9AGAM|nr:hypothetical protein RHS01_11137 [Rhizoctonia solani]